MVAHIARTCFPELYAKRLEEIEGDRDSFNAELPIFYCKSVVLFPVLPGAPVDLFCFATA